MIISASTFEPSVKVKNPLTVTDNAWEVLRGIWRAAIAVQDKLITDFGARAIKNLSNNVFSDRSFVIKSRGMVNDDELIFTKHLNPASSIG